MLTLVTGEPGNGKTALVVSILQQLKGERRIFAWGIPDLTIDHTVCPPVSEWTEQQPIPEDPSLTRPVFRFPPNSVVVVDEAQVVYRVRSASAKVPDHVAALETHRHQGIDIYLITQKPNLIDANVRALVGRHIHLRSNWSGRYKLEWAECKNPNSSADVSVAIRTRYKLPKEVFGLYKSASEHTKVVRRLPPQVYVFTAIVVILVGGGIYIRARMQSMSAPAPVSKASQPEPRSSGEATSPPAAVGRALPVRPPVPSGHLVSSVYVRIGDSVVQNHHYVEYEGGARVRVPGEQCAGVGLDAQCHVGGELVTYAGGLPRPVAASEGNGHVVPVGAPSQASGGVVASVASGLGPRMSDGYAKQGMGR